MSSGQTIVEYVKWTMLTRRCLVSRANSYIFTQWDWQLALLTGHIQNKLTGGKLIIMADLYVNPCYGCPFRRNEDGIECCCFDTLNVIAISQVESCPMEVSDELGKKTS
jgi:hypothetical protein